MLCLHSTLSTHPAKLFITEVSDLSCPPRVLLRQPAQSVTLGSQLTLSCHVAGNFKEAYWSRGGVVIRNNTRSQGGQQFYSLATSGTNKLWLNLTIRNIDM